MAHDTTARDGLCETCGGEGVWCGKHATPDGCDCEDADRTLACDDCGGTGQANDDDDDEDDEDEARP